MTGCEGSEHLEDSNAYLSGSFLKFRDSCDGG